jgi:hypothetical protein
VIRKGFETKARECTFYLINGGSVDVPEQPRHSHRLDGLVAAVLVAVLAGACTGSAKGDQPSSTPSTASLATLPTTTTNSQALARVAVEATYRGWTADVTAANRDPAGAYKRLPEHMTGDALKTMQVYIIDRRHHGLVARGAPKFGTLRITSLTKDHATAQSCIDSTRFLDYRDGQLVEGSAGTVRSYRIGFTLAKS